MPCRNSPVQDQQHSVSQLAGRLLLRFLLDRRPLLWRRKETPVSSERGGSRSRAAPSHPTSPLASCTRERQNS